MIEWSRVLASSSLAVAIGVAVAPAIVAANDPSPPARPRPALSVTVEARVAPACRAEPAHERPLRCLHTS